MSRSFRYAPAPVAGPGRDAETLDAARVLTLAAALHNRVANAGAQWNAPESRPAPVYGPEVA